jgi:RloB-like protein
MLLRPLVPMGRQKKKPWELNNGRKTAIRPIRRYLIICEDERSCCDYLKAFEVDSDFVQVETYGCGMNTDSLVAEAIRKKNSARQSGGYSKIWCVFDRDSFTGQSFNRALIMAERNGLIAIWSNECFELWYLLHFHYRDTAIGRHQLCKELSHRSCLGKTYDKTDTTVFHSLRPSLHKAIERAEKLYLSHGSNINPEKANPATLVHLLVKELLKLKEAIGG